jgi:hypothetical protein
MRVNVKRRTRQKGQAALETVLVIIPLMAVLMAILDFSVAIFVMNTFEYAVRVGVRTAIIQNAGPTGHMDDAIREAVRDNSLGFLANTSTVPDTMLPIHFYKLDSKTNTWVSADGDATPNAHGNLIKVGVSAFSWAWMAPGMWGCADGVAHGCASYNKLSINAASADIMGACALTGCPAI